MELDLRDLEITLSIKNGLINASKEEMIEEYSNLERYYMLLNGLNVLLEKEEEFLLLEDDYIKKILDIINKKRNDYRKILNNEINNIIIKLNNLKSYNSKKVKIKLYEYFKEEEYLRKYKVLSFNGLEKSIAYDIIALTAIETDDLEMVDNIELYLHSLNYLLAKMPALFVDDRILNTCKKSLSMIKENSNIFKIKNILIANSFEKELEYNKKLIL